MSEQPKGNEPRLEYSVRDNEREPYTESTSIVDRDTDLLVSWLERHYPWAFTER